MTTDKKSDKTEAAVVSLVDDTVTTTPTFSTVHVETTPTLNDIVQAIIDAKNTATKQTKKKPTKPRKPKAKAAPKPRPVTFEDVVKAGNINVSNIDSIEDASIHIPEKSVAVLVSVLERWNWRFLNYSQKGPKDVHIPLTQFIPNIFGHQNGGNYLGHLGHAKAYLGEIGIVLEHWVMQTYLPFIERCLKNNEPFRFEYLATVLNQLADKENLELDEYDEEINNADNLQTIVAGKDEHGAPNVGKFVNSQIVQSFFGVYASVNLAQYVWFQGSLKSSKVSKRIEYFSGKKSLSDLGINLSPTLEDFRESAERGKKVVKLNENPSYVFCNNHQEVKGFWRWRKVAARGRAMLDQEGMGLIDPESTNSIQRDLQIQTDNEVSFSKFTDADWASVNPIVYGFSFITKMWGRFHIDEVNEIAFKTDAFNQLVIDPKDKNLILALVKYMDPEKVSDFIENKGGGCTFLFHGKPGLGKTLTAEAVAETVQRPLYVASVGELGTDVSMLEESLNRVLQLASRWNAVLLLDEADIFLEARKEGDIHRNAMVGTFLRLLEYYNGILILTSNRVKCIDPAFYSRISFARKYDDHTPEMREQITKNLLTVNGISHFNDAEVKRIADHDVNGRQLKNSIRIARFYAESENRQVTVDDIADILHRVQHFAEELVDSQ